MKTPLVLLSLFASLTSQADPMSLIPFCQDGIFPEPARAAFISATTPNLQEIVEAGSEGLERGAGRVFFRALFWQASITPRRVVGYGTTSAGPGCYGVFEVHLNERDPMTCIDMVRAPRSRCRL